MNSSVIPILLMASLLAGCASARFYHDDPPLASEDVDYGYSMTSGTMHGMHLTWHDSGGEGPVLLLVHGLASNAGFWRYNVEALTASGVRVIVVDLPGYGKSEKSYKLPYGMRFYAETLEALLSYLTVDKATVAGHSMGGQIAMTMVLQGSARVQRLLLLSPAGIERFGDGEGRWLKDAVSPAFVINTSERQVRANLSANFFSWSDAFEWMVEERVRMAKHPEFEQFAYAVSCCVAAMVDEPVWHRLGELQLPVLILAGEKDNLIPNPYLHGGTTRTVMEAGVAGMPNASLKMIPCAGHMIQIEKPNIVNEAILGFLPDR